MELTVIQAWFILMAMAIVFLAGLCWCFCCGTCVGRSLLRNTGLMRFTRDNQNKRYQNHSTQNENEETWHLEDWEEDEYNNDTHP